MALLLVAMLTMLAVAMVQNIRTAYAVQAQPHTSASYYVTSSSTTSAYNHGWAQGRADALDSSHPNSEVVLDFGGQYADGSGTLTMNGLRLTTAQIEAIAEQYSNGYWNGTGSDLTSVVKLGIGTNNSYYDVSNLGGNAWAGIVNDVRQWNSLNPPGPYCCISKQANAVGANDIEPGWQQPAPSEAWATGYSNGSVTSYLDYGSADGCTTLSSSNTHCFWGYSANCGCNAYWWASDVQNVSWGNPAAWPVPEIYVCCQENTWLDVSYESYYRQGGSIGFEGPMDEYPRANSTYTSTQAWNNLWNTLNSYSQTARNMVYSTELQASW
jgi:hypothetical protein